MLVTGLVETAAATDPLPTVESCTAHTTAVMLRGLRVTRLFCSILVQQSHLPCQALEALVVSLPLTSSTGCKEGHKTAREFPTMCCCLSTLWLPAQSTRAPGCREERARLPEQWVLSICTLGSDPMCESPHVIWFRRDIIREINIFSM